MMGEYIRLIVMIGLFAATVGALALLGRFKKDWLKARVITRYDLIVILIITVVACNVWLRREAHVTAAFHRMYVDEWWPTTLRDSYWFGNPLIKTPLDLWVYQEIMYENRPTVIIETGTWQGGSARYFASMFDLLDEPEGRILTVDIKKFPTPENARATYLIGSSTAPEIVERIRSEIRPDDKVMVVLDSDHSEEHVLKEMQLYGELVTPGQYMVVEDTHLNGNPVWTGSGDPAAAVETFLAQNDRFEADRSREKFGLTFNPNGWLRRTK